MDGSNQNLPEAPCYSEFKSSAQFIFYVGVEKEEFRLPTTLITTCSPKLHALVHSGMKESNDQAATWEHEDPMVFTLFGNFLFKADYDAVKAERARDAVLEEHHPSSFESAGGTHARMYVFGDYHGISTLKTLALYKLYQHLWSYTTMNEWRTDGFVELLAYTLGNTIHVDDGEMDALRNLTIEFSAKWYDHLIIDPNFQKLMDHEFSVPFMMRILPPRQ